MSQNSWELSTRFSHLLQPIRDLTKNWNIDVASALEEYIEEVSDIQYNILVSYVRAINVKSEKNVILLKDMDF